MVCRRKALLAVLPGIVWALATGCGPSREQLSMAKAMSARVDLYPSYQESARFLQKYLAKCDKDYVMWSMDYVSLCLMSGNYDQARRELHRCYKDITTRQDTDKEKAAALSNESMKIFKGEPFERAMVCTYLGLMHYLSGDYNNARIFFARANLEDATTADNMKNFRDDFPLAHYWLGRAFMRLGQNDNARIAYKKAGQRIPRKGQDKETRAIEKRQNKLRKKRMGLEQKSYKQAISDKESAEGVVDISASPAIDQMPSLLPPAKQLIDRDNLPLPPASSLAEFLAPDYQQQVNLILMIEIGSAPIKFLVGEIGERDKIVRSAYEERKIWVYLDSFPV